MHDCSSKLCTVTITKNCSMSSIFATFLVDVLHIDKALEVESTLALENYGTFPRLKLNSATKGYSFIAFIDVDTIENIEAEARWLNDLFPSVKIALFTCKENESEINKKYKNLSHCTVTVRSDVTTVIDQLRKCIFM